MANDKPVLIVSTSLNEAESKKQIQKSLDKIGKQLLIQIGVGKNGTQDISKQAKDFKNYSKELSVTQKQTNSFKNSVRELEVAVKTKAITDDKALQIANRLRKSNIYLQADANTQIKLTKLAETANNNYTKSVDTATKTQKKYNNEIQKTNQIAKDAQSKRWQERFQENLSAMTTPNSGLKSLGEYYKQQEKEFGTVEEFTKLSAKLQAEKDIVKQKVEQYSWDAKKYKLTNDQKINLEAQKSTIQSILNTQAKTTKEIEEQNTALKVAKANMQSIISEAKSTGKTNLNPKEYISGAISATAGWFVATTAFYGFLRAVQSGVQNVFDLDKALTELKKTTTATDAEIEQLAKDSYVMADALAATNIQVIEAVTIFSKMGYALDQSKKLGELAVKLQTVGDNMGSMEDTANSLVAILKGFGVDENSAVAEVSKRIDQLNKVSNEFAVSTGDLTAGLERASGALAISGNSFEQTVALLTSGTEVLRNSEMVARGN